MKIYLAGKVSDIDWRQELLPKKALFIGRDLLEENPDKEDPDYCTNWSWETYRFAFDNVHDYVGPFYMPFASLGSFPKHNAVDGYCRNTHDMELYAGRSRVARLCFEAIEKADLVFAWIDHISAYGTCAELGYAAALGKQIYVNTSSVPHIDLSKDRNMLFSTLVDQPELADFIKSAPSYDPSDHLKGDDYWLPQTLSTIEIDETAVGSDVKTVFDAVLAKAEEKYYPTRRNDLLSRVIHESPIEKRLIETMYETRTQMLDMVVNQFKFGKYLLDFAVPEIKLCIELDGHDGHKTKEQRTHDARKDRALTADGWHVIRYTGSEVHKDRVRVCRDIFNHINRMFKEAGYS